MTGSGVEDLELIAALRTLILQCLLPDQVRLGRQLVNLVRDGGRRHRAGPDQETFP